MTKTTDPAETLIAELRGTCGPHVIAGVNGNLPPGWEATGLVALHRYPPPSWIVVVFCNGAMIDRPLDHGVGARLEIEAGTPAADHLRIADALAAQLRAAIETRELGDGLRIRVALARGAVLPERKTEGASGYDLCALAGCTVMPGVVAKIRTGVHLQIPPGMEAQVRPRSGLAMRGLWVHVATVDSDYRGECWVIAANLTAEPVTVGAGDRIAQLVFARVERPELMVVEVGELSSTERGARGLGSTGTR